MQLPLWRPFLSPDPLRRPRPWAAIHSWELSVGETLRPYMRQFGTWIDPKIGPIFDIDKGGTL